jgi:carbon starvation protein
MHGWRYVWISMVPLVWLVTVTFTAAIEKIFSPLPRIGFLAQAAQLAAGPQTAATSTLIFNAKLDAVICGTFLVLVGIILIDSLRVWVGILFGSRTATVSESPFVPSRLSAEGL